MAPHSSTLAWEIPWTEGPGRLKSMGSLGVGHDWATSLSLFTFMHWRRKWQPTPVLLPGESQGWGAWWAAVYGVTQSRIRLKWLSSSSSSGNKDSQAAYFGFYLFFIPVGKEAPNPISGQCWSRKIVYLQFTASKQDLFVQNSRSLLQISNRQLVRKVFLFSF